MSYLPNHLIAQFPEWKYCDFEYRALQISTELKQRKIHSIAVWLEDGAKLACTLLGAWHANVRVLFVPNFTPESIEWANEFADLWITDTEIELQKAEYFDHFALNTQLQSSAEIRPLVDETNHTEIWLKTSGSTGKAKTIVKTAQEMWVGARAIADGLHYQPDNKVTAISTVSIQHIYGLTVHIMMSLVLGWQLGRKQLFFPECVLQESSKSEKAVVISSPAMLTRIDWQNTKIPAQVKSIISSGGALAEEASSEIRARLNASVIEIYGSTETGPIAWRDHIGSWAIFPNSQVGQNENGELWLEAAWLKNREQTADMIELTDDGFVLLGRSDRIVKIGDKRTSLVNVENALMQHTYIEDCYIAKHPEQPRLAAWVGLSLEGIETLREKGRRAVTTALKQHLAKTQEKSAIPRFWRLTDKLPRNSQSKINKLEFNQICIEKQTVPIWLNEQSVDNIYFAKGKVPLDLVFLKDHFANFPLVPGVIELQWISDKIQQFFTTNFGKNVDIVSIDKLKFQRFLRPNDIFSIELKWLSEKKRMMFSLIVDDEVCCNGFAIIND